MDKVRWGIVGTGNIAHKFARAVKNVENAHLAAAASRNIGKAQSFANEFGIEKFFGSYEDMAKSDALDAVYIATPHSLHAGCSQLFMKHKKHVLCEKPAAVNERELSETAAMARESGLFFMEALWTRFLPAIQELKKMTNEGIIGEVQGISADFCYNSSDDKTSHVFDVKNGGGSLLDVGIYGLNFAAIFVDAQPREIKAMAQKVNGIDENMHILLSHENGAISRISSALTVEKPCDAYIYGSGGYVFVPDFYCAQKFFVYDNSHNYKEYEYKYSGNGFEEEIEECCKCIAAGKTQSDIMPIEESLKILRLMDAVRMQTGIIYPMDRRSYS